MSVSSTLLSQEIVVSMTEFIQSLYNQLQPKIPNIDIQSQYNKISTLIETYKDDILNAASPYIKKVTTSSYWLSCISLFDDSIFSEKESSSQAEVQEQEDNENNVDNNNEDNENNNNDDIDDKYVTYIENMFKNETEEENSFINFAMDAFVESIKEKIDIENIISEKLSIENIKDTASQAFTGIILVAKLFGCSDNKVNIFVMLRGILNFIDLNSIPKFLWDNRGNLDRNTIGLALREQLYETIEEAMAEDEQKYKFYKNILNGNFSDEFNNVKIQLNDDKEQYIRFVVNKYKKSIAYMRYLYYNTRVRFASSEYSNNKYDDILKKYIQSSLAYLYGVNINNVYAIKSHKGRMRYYFTVNGIKRYKWLDHANSYKEFKKEYRDFKKEYKKLKEDYRKQNKDAAFKQKGRATNGSPNRNSRRDGKNPLKSTLVLEFSNFGVSFLAETFIDYKLPIIDRDEYERNKAAIEFAYTSKRVNNFGSIWNEDKYKRFFTMPRSITQNYIMADFRAMVAGGAHFDNSCFIKGTSSGIFVQDNKVVSRSFIEVIIDHIDVMSRIDIDKKMGKYLLAYCNVINYIYQLSNVHNDTIGKHNEYIQNVSSILSSVGMSLGNGVIHQVKEKQDETNESIINNYYVQNDNFLMKDFVIQLKRIGESNYKFYHTQEEISTNNKKNQDNELLQSDTDSSYDNKEMPLLLGSLIYDETWYRTDIDKNN